MIFLFLSFSAITKMMLNRRLKKIASVFEKKGKTAFLRRALKMYQVSVTM